MSTTHQDRTIPKLLLGPASNQVLSNQDQLLMLNTIKLLSALKVQKSRVLIFGVDTELFLPELNSGRVDPIECMTGLSLFEPLAQMASLVPGALLGCSPNCVVIVSGLSAQQIASDQESIFRSMDFA
jgi:hypothetical protein